MSRKYWKPGSSATVAMVLVVTRPRCSDDGETAPSGGTGGGGTGAGGVGGEAPEWPPDDVTAKIRVVVDQDLIQTVQPQSGFPG